MSKYWLAAFAVPVFTLSLLASGGAAVAAESPVNLIATYGTVQNTDGLMGVIGVSGDATYMYNYTSLPQGESAAAADVDCNSTWDARQILCDPAPTTNVSGILTQADNNGGYTSNKQDANTVSYIVIDLGESRTFTSLEIFQMRQSDGSVSQAELFVNGTMGDVWPVQTDEDWRSVAAAPVAAGEDQTGTGPYTNTAVTTFDFDATASRYVMLQFQNDGSTGPADYIEVAGVKLFGITTPAVVPEPEPLPAVVPDPALAPTGVDVVPAGLIALAALAVGAALLLMRRRAAAAE